ncbi:MAG: hypothetical protein LBK23_08760 [Oscillospiraceae bacterium]|jgi:hypothetical protein|nr:hypothetical protein [Oscillospiraceae bacterium]
MAKYYAGAQNDTAYLSSDIDARAYILSRTHYLSGAPQKHFDKFIIDIIALLDNDIKCKAAMLNNGISEEQVSSSLEILEIFGR